MAEQELYRVLERVDDVTAGGDLPLVVFDLDSTLFSTKQRNLAILEEFAAEHAGEFPELAGHVEALEPADMGWNTLQPVRDRGYEHARLSERFAPYWYERFFTDEYLAHDVPNPGAVTFAKACHERGALLYYLTGRHVGGMEVGTVQALVRHGFPYFRGRALLHLKPSYDMPDFAYKEQAVGDIRSHGGVVVATFENHPANANLFARSFPDALNFLLETEAPDDAPEPRPELIRIPDFRVG